MYINKISLITIKREKLWTSTKLAKSAILLTCIRLTWMHYITIFLALHSLLEIWYTLRKRKSRKMFLIPFTAWDETRFLSSLICFLFDIIFLGMLQRPSKLQDPMKTKASGIFFYFSSFFLFCGMSWVGKSGSESRRHNVIKMSHTFNNFMTATKS